MRQITDSDDGSPAPAQLSPKAVLRHNYLFRGLADATLDGIAALAVKRTYYKGSVIFSQGDEGDALFGVASGRVRISASASGGREVFLNIMEPGDTFGEIAVMDGLPRTANAMALDTSTLIVIQRGDFLPLLEREPQLAMHGRAARVGHLELRISQGELARFLGVTRQVVNHHLSDWRRRGWIELGRTQIVIRNTEALRAMIAESASD
jgi:CRP-like cAMP-binding protein